MTDTSASLTFNRRITLYIAFFIAFITFIVFLPALQSKFLNWDDDHFIIDNAGIRSLDWHFIQWAFTNTTSTFWNPLAWIALAINYWVWGLNPFGYHLGNIILHAINTFLVVFLVIALLNARNRARQLDATALPLDQVFIWITAGVTGALFGMHPLHVEPVAWANGLGDLLYSFFFILSIMMYIRYVMKSDPAPGARSTPFWLDRHYLLGFCFFVLSIATKASAIMLPFILLILDWYPLKRINSLRRLVVLGKEKLPFFVVSFIDIAGTLISYRGNADNLQFEGQSSLPARILVACKALVTYLWHILAPVSLNPYSQYPQDSEIFTFSYAFFFVCVLIVSVFSFALIRYKKNRLVPAVLTSYVVLLLPMLGLLKSRTVEMADRYAYLSSIGPFLLIGLSVAWFWQRTASVNHGKNAFRTLIVSVAMICCGFTVYLTHQQIGIWEDSLTFWTAVIKRETRPSAIPFVNRAMALIGKKEYKLALADLDIAVVSGPRHFNAYLDRALVHLKLNELDLALKDYDFCSYLIPGAYAPFFGRAEVFVGKGEFDRAVLEYDNMIRLHPTEVPAYLAKGSLLTRMGRTSAALNAFNSAGSLNPEDASPYYGRSKVYLKTKQFGLALHECDEAIKMHPSDFSAFLSLGEVLFAMGNDNKALEAYSRAIELQPNASLSYQVRGKLYRARGDEQSAMQDFKKSCELGDDEACSYIKNTAR
jgi:tetratricopeptide (TPR) repeat protein